MSFDKLKAYLDLTRLHFSIIWPLLFCSGLFLSFPNYGGFSWPLVGKAAIIAFLGFEAGFVLNDYVDREVDGRDVDSKLTKYWRPFGTRPIPSGAITPSSALLLFGVLAASTSALILTLPYPNSVYVLGIMAGLLVLTGANILIRRGRTPSDWMKALPLFHVTMLVYIVSMIADYFI